MGPSSAALAASARATTSVSSLEELDGLTLEAAVTEGDTRMVQHLIANTSCDLAEHSDLLFICCEKGHTDIAALLLAADSGLRDQAFRTELRTSPSQHTPLHIACTHGNAGVVRVLLASRAEVDARGRYNVTPLLCACTSEAGHECAKLLLAAGAGVNKSRDSGSTPLYAAASNALTETVKLLLGANAEVDALMQPVRPSGGDLAAKMGATGELAARMKYRLGTTPLFAACVNGHLEVVRLLLDAGAEASLPLISGSSALHASAAKGHMQILRLLLSSRADANTAKDDGTTPLSAAALGGHAGCVGALLNAGARDWLALDDPEAVGSKERFERAPGQSGLALKAALTCDDAPHRACAELIRRALSANTTAEDLEKARAEAEAEERARADTVAEALIAAEAAEQSNLAQAAARRKGKKHRREMTKAACAAAAGAGCRGLQLLARSSSGGGVLNVEGYAEEC